MLKLLLLSLLILGCILSAILVVFALNPIHAVFFLIVAFLCSSGLLFLHGTYFFALVLLIVYVGAVAVLFLFVIMMLDTKKVTSEREGFKKEVFVSFQKIFFFFLVSLFFLLLSFDFNGSITSFNVAFVAQNFIFEPYAAYFNNNLLTLASLLYTYFGLLLFVIGFILFLVIFLVINLTKNKRYTYKRQISYMQIYRDFDTTIHLVSKIKKK